MVALRSLITAAALACMAALYAENTSTAIFDDSFRTLTVQIEGDRLAPPVLTLNGSDRLIIGFDRLSDERDYLRYTIRHCNADWTPSQLVDAEVFDGFNYADVTEYAFSRATTVHYVHYTIVLPDSEFRFRLSGNYLLQVYDESDPDEILLQQRFMVCENAVGVGGTATSRTDVDYNDSHQQLELQLDTRGYPVRDPFNDLTLVVEQNYYPASRRVITHPTRMQGDRLLYEHQPQLVFPASNEYRRMETVSVQFPTMGVDHVEYNAPYYNHYLNVDTPRFSRNYSYDSTQHGRFFVREYNSDNSDTEADYTIVHFTLDQPEIPGAAVYLEGDFTHRTCDSNSQVPYNPSTGRYERAMLLKQGAYNYRYVAVPPKFPVEGDKYQTVNEYSVAVYYRAPGERYDRLLGYSLIFSGR